MKKPIPKEKSREKKYFKKFLLFCHIKKWLQQERNMQCNMG
jgi:hypothetical protein